MQAICFPVCAIICGCHRRRVWSFSESNKLPKNCKRVELKHTSLIEITCTYLSVFLIFRGSLRFVRRNTCMKVTIRCEHMAANCMSKTTAKKQMNTKLNGSYSLRVEVADDDDDNDLSAPLFSSFCAITM